MLKFVLVTTVATIGIAFVAHAPAPVLDATCKRCAPYISTASASVAQLTLAGVIVTTE